MKRIIGILTKYLFLLIWIFICLYPLLTIFFGSMKTYDEFNSTKGITLPRQFSFNNYHEAIVNGNLPVAFINTFILVFLGVLGSVIIGSMVAYILNRFEFKGKKLVIGSYFLISMVPMVISQISTFRIITFLNLYDKLLGPVLIYLGADVVMIFVYLQMYEKIPRDLDKAALLEGASYFTIYRKILFPLLKPATATVVMLKMISIYNDFYIPFLYLPSGDKQTISTALYQFIGPNETQWQVICALIILSIIPMLIVFVALQKNIYNGLSGGVKG